MCGKCLFNAGPGQPSSEDTWLITSKRASTVDWLEEECPKKGTILKRITHLQPCPHSQIGPNLSPNLEKMTQSPRNGVSWWPCQAGRGQVVHPLSVPNKLH